MRAILFIHGGKVEQDVISQRFRLRLEWAIDYYRQNHEAQEIIFL